jgi:hypothetical protein
MVILDMRHFAKCHSWDAYEDDPSNRRRNQSSKRGRDGPSVWSTPPARCSPSSFLGMPRVVAADVASAAAGTVVAGSLVAPVVIMSGAPVATAPEVSPGPLTIEELDEEEPEAFCFEPALVEDDCATSRSRAPNSFQMRD